MIISIDGPTASGKSTAARILAKKLGLYYLNSGLLFRAIAYILIHKRKYKEDDLSDKVHIKDISFCINHCQYFFYPTTGEHIFFDSQEITPFLKQPTIDHASSLIGMNVHVRQQILNWLRSIAQNHDVVIDGRDVGSVIFPDAQFKFFMTAPIDVRVGRWMKDQEKRGNTFTFEQAKKLVEERDTRDQERSIAPLKMAENSFIIDNGELAPEQTVDLMMKDIKKE